MAYYHESVLLKESIEYLNIKPDGVYLDGTLGGAGHSQEILRKIDNGLLISIDRDKDAIIYSNEKLRLVGGNFVLCHANFKDIEDVLSELEIDMLDGAILDLGVSSYQLDEVQRGFSYHTDSRLDMRMDQLQKLDAYEVVNTYKEEALEYIIKEYGEERWAKRIAEFIVDNRPIKTTLELVEVIKKAVPAGAREDKHPARKTFQAIRIEVNSELEILEKAVETIIKRLKPGARLAVITFHSLEDRIVKQVFKRLASTCICPPELPVCTCEKKKEVEIITNKPITASLKELQFNPRSRSAKLRVVEKVL